MRGSAVGGILAAWLLAVGCSLGIVDLPTEPSPAELVVVSELSAHPDDPALVRVSVVASLEPGIGREGAARDVLDDVLGVEATLHEPEPDADGTFRWSAAEVFTAPGPPSVELRLPRLEGLPPPRDVNMRVRVDVTPAAGVVALDPGEDLVLVAAEPTNPSSRVSWYVQVRSATDPSFRLNLNGDGTAWPDTVRVPALQLPPGAFPLDVRWGILWDRTVDISALSPAERYDLHLRSILLVDWRVTAED